MNCIPLEKEQKNKFQKIYKQGQLPVILEIEHSVFGSNYGANSWTTRSQADEMSRMLNLQSQHNLLDLGAGSGWPGLYLAKQSGCQLVLVDLPTAGLNIALQRSKRDGHNMKTLALAADAAQLPFYGQRFDAISHSDILCCLQKKRETLVACREVIRPGGRMVFTVVAIAPNLSDQEIAEAIENGPQFVQSPTNYSKLLDETGWQILEYRDLTEECADVCRQLMIIDSEKERELHEAIGFDSFHERQADWRNRLYAIERKLLRRELYFVVPA
ncbi:MAG: hypothetical protein CL398_09900 [Acidiferrobacteraceae bacterium]|nr:hypothetical protein [Acidiferrobacteraceae bacterium]